MFGSGNDLGFGITVNLEDNFSKQAMNIGKGMGFLTDGFSNVGKNSFLMNEMSQGVNTLISTLDSFISIGSEFDFKMKEVQAITGASGETLNEISKNGRELAKIYGGSAADSVESFKIILSRLSTDIAKSPEALKKMGENVSILSKTMGGDVKGSVDALTTAMNQYAVDLSNPLKASEEMTRMMDIMAKGAQLGAAEVPQISQALAVSGLSAKMAGVSFEEANAAIQVLAKGSLFGSEAGTKLRNAIGRLGEGRFMPKKTLDALTAAGVNVDVLGDKTISLADRLTELSKIQNDTALVSQFFGVENENAGKVLLSNIPQMKEWTSQIYEKGNAELQAGIIMGSYTERLKRIKSRMQDYAISIFEATKSMLPYIQTTLQMTASLMQTLPGLYSLINVFPKLITGFGGMASATWAAMAPLLPIVGIIAGLGAAIYFTVDALGVQGNALGKMKTLFNGAIELFSTWNGETAQISEETKKSLDENGLMPFFEKFSVAIFGIMEFAKPFVDVIGGIFTQTFETLKPIVPLFESIGKLIVELGTSLGILSPSTNTAAGAGQILASVFSFLLFPLRLTLYAVEYLIKGFTWMIEKIVWAISTYREFMAGLKESNSIWYYVAKGIQYMLMPITLVWDMIQLVIGGINKLTESSLFKGIMSTLGLDKKKENVIPRLTGEEYNQAFVKNKTTNPYNTDNPFEAITNNGNSIPETKAQIEKQKQDGIKNLVTKQNQGANKEIYVQSNLFLDGNQIAEAVNKVNNDKENRG